MIDGESWETRNGVGIKDESNGHGWELVREKEGNSAIMSHP